MTTEALTPGAPTQPSPEVKTAFERGTSLELQIAACQVARWFLLTKGEQHTQCLDVPPGMFGASFGPKVERPDGLLRCCPVARAFGSGGFHLAKTLTSQPETGRISWTQSPITASC